MDTTTAPPKDDTEVLPTAGWAVRTARHPKTRRVGRIVTRAYITLLLLATTVQAVVLFLLWKWPSYGWGALADRFVTSPAMAGLFAVIAAVIGAWSLNRQLTHTKQKTEDEAWWEQFEWVTDRIVSPDNETEKSKDAKDPLPKSLAYNLMTALSKTARAPFQKAAVAGIFSHYFRDNPSPTRDGAETSDDPHMDATEAESLRALLATLPSDSTSNVGAQKLLSAYDRYHRYEEEVQKALRHRYGPAHSEPSRVDVGADATIEFGTYKLLVEVKESLRSRSALTKTIEQLRKAAAREGAAGAVIITNRPSLISSLPREQSKQILNQLQEMSEEGIHLIEWVPAEGSGALRDRIRAILPNKYR